MISDGNKTLAGWEFLIFCSQIVTLSRLSEHKISYRRTMDTDCLEVNWFAKL